MCIYNICFKSHTSWKVEDFKPPSSGSSPPPPQGPCTPLPPALGLGARCLFTPGLLAGQPLLSSRASGRHVSPPERGQCSLLRGQVQTGLLIRTSARSGQDLPLCAGSVVSPHVQHMVTPGQDTRSKWTGEPNRPALPVGVGGDRALLWEGISVSGLSFLPSSLSFSVFFQEGGFLDFYVFSWERVSFNSEKNSTTEEVQRWPGQRGEQGGGCGAGLPPGHLSHLSQHHPRCTRFKCSCLSPASPWPLIPP